MAYNDGVNVNQRMLTNWNQLQDTVKNGPFYSDQFCVAAGWDSIWRAAGASPECEGVGGGEAGAVLITYPRTWRHLRTREFCSSATQVSTFGP